MVSALSEKGATMSDYIKREELREAFGMAKECSECSRNTTEFCVGNHISVPTICDILENLPSADVVERKRGEWIENEPYPSRWICKCSICGCPSTSNNHKFCCQCGAVMR